MNEFNRKRLISLKHAFSGLAYVFRTQKNTRVYLVFTILVLAFAFFLNVSWLEWIILLLLIGLVWAAECINTAIETGIDLVTRDFHPIAKIAKDTSAAGVLMLALTAALIGLYIFGRHIYLIIFSGG
ncbi:MAG: diacylglycerol kinase family protein [bacterium]